MPASDLDLPRWTPFVTAGAAVTIGAGTFAQRAQTTSVAQDLLLVLVAVAPWVVAIVRPLPLSVWFATVVGAVSVLLLEPTPTDFSPFLLVLLAGTIAALVHPRLSFPAAVVAALPTVVLELLGQYDGSLIWAFATFFSWFFGTGFRWQLETLRQLHVAQDGLADRAAAEERQRLAYEVHDVVAHTMSVAMLHITGARLALVDGDIDEAAAGLAEAERSGREAMQEIRRSVGLLTPNPPGAGTGTVDIGAAIAAVVQRFTEAGLIVQVNVDGGRAGEVPTATADALVRIVQEALANASRHGDGTAVVLSTSRSATTLSIEVTNRRRSDGCRDEGGVGTTSMRVRASSIGGECTSGPVGNDRWLVRIEVPV